MIFAVINHIENSNEFYLIISAHARPPTTETNKQTKKNSTIEIHWKLFDVVLRFTPLSYDIFHFNVHIENGWSEEGRDVSTLISKNCPI